MSKLDELVNELCPNGVPYKTIEEIAVKVFAGGTPTSSNDSYYGGDIPWLRSGEVNFNIIKSTEIFITEEGFNSSSARWVKPHSVLLAMTGATVARSAVNDIALTANQSVAAIEPKELINYRFLYFCISNMYESIKGMAQGALTSINLKIIKALKIPVPSIEVQCEIVRILDNFTELQNTLNEEYERRSQTYDSVSTALFDNLYNTSKLVTVSNVAKNQSVKNKGEVCKDAFSITQSGLARTSDFFKDAKVTSSDTSTYKIVKPGWFVYSPSRIDVGSIDYSKIDFDVIVTSLDVVFSIDENKIDKDFLLLFLKSKKGMFQILANRQGIEGTGRKTIPFANFGKVKIPLPSLTEQRTIIEKLSKLSDYNKTLKLEMTKRQKQYEYYRDKLLTFKELEA